MAGNRTHSIISGNKGLYVVVKDTTTWDVYTDNGIDINNDYVGGTIIITNSELDIATYTLGPNDMISLRDVNGLVLEPADFSGLTSSIFEDGRYDISTTIEFTGDILLSCITDNVFYGEALNKISKVIINSNWKDAFGDRSVYKDNSIKLKSWYDSVVMANELGLIDEAERILNVINRVVK